MQQTYYFSVDVPFLQTCAHLFLLEGLLHVVPVPPVLHEFLHLGDGEHVVLEVVDDLHQLLLDATRLVTGRLSTN